MRPDALRLKALELSRREDGRYATQEPGLRVLIKMSLTTIAPNLGQDGDYLKRLPDDPLDGTYQCRNPRVRGEIDVFSYGADGKQGGEGIDADVG
jgi:general secretion pathway protein G